MALTSKVFKQIDSRHVVILPPFRLRCRRPTPSRRTRSIPYLDRTRQVRHRVRQKPIQSFRQPPTPKNVQTTQVSNRRLSNFRFSRATSAPLSLPLNHRISLALNLPAKLTATNFLRYNRTKTKMFSAAKRNSNIAGLRSPRNLITLDNFPIG